MRTTWGVVRAIACASILVATACGDNITEGGGIVVSPEGGLRTNETGGTATFTIKLSNAPMRPITVDLESSNTAEGTVAPATVTLNADNFDSGQTITVTGVDDDVADGSQLYQIRVEPNGLDAMSVAVTNDDDDAIGVRVTPTAGLVTTKQGGTATFTVALTSKPSGAVTVPLSSSDTDQGTIDQASLTFTDADWHDERTVTITGQNDGLFNGNIMYTIVTGSTSSADAAYNGVSVDDVSVTNLGATLVDLELEPVNPTVALGTDQQFTATGIFDDTTTLDVTQAVTWGSSALATATISNSTGTQGLASTHAIGTSTISASLSGVTADTTLTVSPATLVSIAVTPANQSVPDGSTVNYTATGVYSDSSTQDLTTQVLWTSSVLATATISNATGLKGRASALAAGTTEITATLGAISGSTTLTVTAAVLVSIQVTPVDPTIAKGSTQQFQATGIFSDGTSQPLTATALWASAQTGVATISNVAGTKGLATGVAPGTSTITATFDGIVGSSLLTVTAATLASIDVTPTNSSTTKGATVPFTATGVFTDSTTQDITTQVTWASTLTSVATISNVTGTQGVATAQNVGQTTITATLGAITGQTTLTVTAATLVSFTIAPTNASNAKGTTRQFTATGLFSDNTTQNITTQVTWGSTLGAVATISNAAGSQGLATAVGVGTTVISATLGGMTVTTNFTVTAAVLVTLEITPTNPSIPDGTNIQFTATAVFSDGSTQNVTASTTWSSSSTAVATIGNAPGNRGRANGQSPGTTTITGLFSGVSGTTTLTVTAAVLQSIQVTPTNPSSPKGTTRQFTATGSFSDGTTQNLTAVAVWSSTNAAVATISNAAGSQGLASALNLGTTTIRATFGGQTGQTTFTVTAATLASIQVTPPNPSAAKGTSLPFVATGTFSDGTTQNVTTLVTWGSSAQNVATISNVAGSQGLATTVDTGTTTISATSGAIVGTTTLTVTAATLQTIQVTPVNPSIADGTTLQFIATGIYSDNSTQDLTTQATWSATVAGVATVSNAAGSQGLATAVDPGSTQVRATFGGVQGATTLTVTAATLASIQVTPANASIADGTTLQYVATGVYTDGSTQNLTTQVTWASSSTPVATISNAGGTQGLASANDPGTATISATLGAVTGSTTLTVTAALLVAIQVTPTNPSIADGTTLQFTAIGTYTNGSTQNLTTQASWQSTTIATATISNAVGSQGLATATAPGTTTISATFGGVTGSTVLTVTPATLVSIAVTPTNASIADGTTLQYTATGTYTDNSTQNLTTQVLWASSTSTIASISNAAGSQGLATGVDPGSTTISATLGAVTGSTTLTVTAATLVSIAVTPTNPSIADGTSLQFIAIGTYTDSSTQNLTQAATWSSSNATTASISNAAGSQGVATADNPGTTTIGATFGGVSGSTLLTVTPATLMSIAVTPTNASVADGTTLQYTAIGTFTNGTTQDLTATATWASTNNTVAAVSNAPGTKGLATAASPGTTTISATSGGTSGSTQLTVTPATVVSIQVTPIGPSIADGTTQQFIAIATYTDGSMQDVTTQATWASTDGAVATISNAAGSQGLATSTGAGSTTISATFGGASDSTTLTVTAATLVSIQVTPTNASVADGTTLQYTATGIYTDGSTQDLTGVATWTSSTTAAAISNAPGTKGLATALDPGSTTISAFADGKTGSTTLTVTGATLSSIQVTPAAQTIADGTTLQYTATGVYTDGSVQDLTTQASWSSNNSAAATISNVPGTQGLATAANPGSTTISAIFGGMSGSTTLTVTAATLASIDVQPTNASIANGTTLQYTATGIYTDGTSQDITSQATWSSTLPGIATISNTPGSNGLATGTGNGTTTISAALDGKTGSTSLTVTGVVLTSVVVTPGNPTAAKGASVQFTCTGVYSDNSTQDLTATALWATTNASVATVSNAPGTQGLATAVEIGAADISCTSGGFTDASTLTVTAAAITSITITPANPSVAAGVQLQFTATVLYSDGLVQDITEDALWTSSNSAVASVSNQAGFEGLATTTAAGSTTITAQFGGSSGTTLLTVTNATLLSISVQPANATIARNTQLQYVALGTFSDGSTQDITSVATWQSSNTTVASISNAAATIGIATGGNTAGTTTISAIYQGVTGSTTLTVTGATLVSIAITPANPTMVDGSQLQLIATGTFSDGSTQNLTLQVNWKSQNNQVVKVRQGRRLKGVATAINPGTSIVTATTLGVSGNTTITVVP